MCQGMLVGALVDDLIGPQEEGLGNGEPQRLGGLEIDHQLELVRLLDGQVAGLGALEDLVDSSGAPSCRARRGAEGT